MLDLWTHAIPLFDENIPQGKPAIDPYLLAGNYPTACVIVFPGGGYVGHAPHESEPVAQWLNSLGIAPFVLRYRTAPYRHPAPLLDAQRAIRMVRTRAKDFNVDPKRIGILGFSAGGHLASTTGTHYDGGNKESPDPIERVSSRPDALILCYPVITFGDYCHAGSRAALLGDDPPESLVRLLSNELQVTTDTPATFLWHTANDESVPVKNSLLFASALNHHKVPFDLHIFSDGPHGVGLAEEHPTLSMWTKCCAAWLREIGFIDRSVTGNS
jgi:acetyl esterase/lipase